MADDFTSRQMLPEPSKMQTAVSFTATSRPISVHAARPFLMLAAVWTDQRLSSARSAAPSCITVEEGPKPNTPSN